MSDMEWEVNDPPPRPVVENLPPIHEDEGPSIEIGPGVTVTKLPEEEKENRSPIDKARGEVDGV